MHQPTVEVIERRARADRAAALARLRATAPEIELEALTDLIATRSRLTVNFHPDRVDRHGRTVAAGLLADGRYRHQYETGISNGGRFAVPGGARTRWEAELFDLDPDTTRELDRPVYGALDLTRDPHGGSPRFGSSYLVLDAGCFDRATFCVGDSHEGPTDVGTADELSSIAAGVAEGATRGDGLGRGLQLDGLQAAIANGAAQPARCLDGYVEAQVHGGVTLATDVLEIVLDPSFRGTSVETDLRMLADRTGAQLSWHGGSRLAAADTPADFRGPTMPSLARATANTDGMLDAAAIGRALRGITYEPPTPDGDPEDGPLQQYKKLWHCVLRFGSDARPVAET